MPQPEETGDDVKSLTDGLVAESPPQESIDPIREKEGHQNRIAWISLAVALLSLFISGSTLYVSHLSPFNPTVSLASDIYLTPATGAVGRGLYVRLHIFNEGAMEGEIKDIMLEFRRTGGPVHYLFPVWYLKADPAPDMSNSNYESEFHPVYLQGKTGITKRVLFVPNPQITWLKRGDAGEYKVAVMILKGGVYKEVNQMDIVISEKHWDGIIEASQKGMSILLRDINVRRAREKILGKQPRDSVIGIAGTVHVKGKKGSVTFPESLQDIFQ